VKDATVELIDEILGDGRHRLATRLHLAPMLPIDADGGVVSAGGVQIKFEGATAVEEKCEVARRFGESLPALCLSAYLEARLPTRISSCLSLMSPASQPSETA
jgi:hypothetical protein